MDKQEAEFQQRVSGYPCIFARTVGEAAASLLRAITAESGVISGGGSSVAGANRGMARWE
jgi:hypothetical protein